MIKANNKKFFSWVSEIFRFFYPYVKRDRKYLFILSALNIVTTSTSAFLIWKLGSAIGQISAGEFDQLNETLLVIAGLVLFNQMIGFIYAYIINRVTLRFVDSVRGRLLEHIMYLSFPVFYYFKKGDLIARLTGDVDRMLTFVVNVPLNLFSTMIVFIVYSTMLFWIDWTLSLIVIAMAPVFFLSQHYVAPRTGAASKSFTQEKAKLLNIENETLSNLRGISAFNSEDRIREKHQNQFNVARAWALKLRQINILYNSGFTILLYLAGVVVVYSGVSSIKSGELSIGVLVSFLIYVRNLTGPVRGLARMPVRLQTDRVAADRLMEVMTTKPNILGNESAAEHKIEHGRIDFRQVNFAYPNQTQPVFKDLSASVNAGETIALIGPSGSGKSTFAGLLLRFYEPQSGEILIDGVNIHQHTVKSLRDQISIVWQDPFIINGSIKDNFLLASPAATDEQIIAACKSSHAWEFIAKLEAGIDTIVGTGGINLSVGQKQRLAIGQAFLRDSPILILDEASSALDSYSEQQIVSAITTLCANRTTIIIAHRFSSIRNARRIFYFDGNGSITIGTHDELMNTHQDYCDAVKWQTSMNSYIH